MRDKKTILENLDIYDNDLITKGKENFEENSESLCIKKQKLDKYELEVPKNIELVSHNFIHDCFGDPLDDILREQSILLGCQNIFIYDVAGKYKHEIKANSLYCCSLQDEGDDCYNFSVRVDYILSFGNDEVLQKQIFRLQKLGGLIDYLKESNIDINKEGEQDIKDENEEIIGKFVKFQKEDNDDTFDQEESDINNNSNNNNLNNNELNNNSLNNNNINNNNTNQINQMNNFQNNINNNNMIFNNYFLMNNLNKINNQMNNNNLNNNNMIKGFNFNNNQNNFIK